MCSARAPLLLAALLTGCATASPPLYSWGNYESSIYVRYTGNDRAQAQQYLEEVIQAGGNGKGRVPPGVYADYGMLLYQQGRNAEAVEYFQKEAAAFPEAAPLMTKLVERVAHQPAPAASVASASGPSKADVRPTGTGAAVGGVVPEADGSPAQPRSGGGM